MCPLSGILQCFIVVVLLLIFLQKAVAELNWTLLHDQLVDSIQMKEAVDVNYNVSVIGKFDDPSIDFSSAK